MLLDELLRMARVYSAGSRFYSPSARAAAEVGQTQKRGTWQQLRAAMLDAGAKPDEMAWTGLDREMAARQGPVDTDEIIQYLRDRSDMLDVEESTASGVLRKSSLGDRRELVSRVVQDRLPGEIESYRTDILPDEVRERAVPLGDLSDDDLIALLDELPGDPPSSAYDRDAAVKLLKEEYGDDAVVVPSGEFSRRQSRPLLVTDDTISDIVDEWLDPVARAEESIVQWANSLDYDELLDELGMANIADTSEVRYAKYYPEGAIDYTERVYKLDRDKTPIPNPFEVADDPHWGSEDVIGHTRTSRFPTRQGGEAYHLGELQSDWAQRARRGEGVRTLGEEETLKRADDAWKALDRMVGELPDRARAALGERPGANRSGAENVVEAFGFVTPSRADAVNAVIQRLNPDTWFRQPLLRPGDVDMRHPDAAFNRGRPDPARTLLTAVERNVSDPRQDDLPGLQNPVRAIADDLEAEIRSRTGVQSFDELRGLLDALEGPLRDKEPAGPSVHTTDKWVDMLLKRELNNALGSRAEYLTIPTPDLVRWYTGGQYGGHEKFYGEIVPRRMSTLLKRYDPDAAKPTFVDIITEDSGDVRVPAFRITKRLREQADRLGIPLWMLVGAAPLGLLDAMGQRD
jgi:hypothetical protein